MRQTWRLLWQTAVLAAIAWLADYAVTVLDLPVPGNVLGIMVLFLLLSAGVVKERWISEAASFLLRHLVFFFIPVAVGLMNWGEVFYDYGWVLLGAIVGSTALPLLVTGWLAGALRRRPEKEKAQCS
ncbi:CidA/LrgA family protein [Desulfovibrio sp. PG-178-WT-4]|uniref:CidA/LrgA family protein n=1 Tax=Desulfovibrio porci TaxID=2605782 RepID=A0A6L5XLZ3_9BACT|nr:CidA/LrgA family protein [Desulfovibrio porci]MSS27841.1 CidA/LrgA family protein [Desulfovibrio porci]